MPHTPTCVVPGCRKTKAKNEELSFFSFPSALDPRRNQWCEVLGIFPPQDFDKFFKTKKVCSAHFDQTQLKWRPFLVENAMPNGRGIGNEENAVAVIDGAEIVQAQPVLRSPNIIRETALTVIGNRLHNDLKRKSTELETSNKKLATSATEKQRLFDRVLKLESQELTEKMIEEHFSESKSLLSIIKMQVLREGKEKVSRYSDLEKTVALTIFYSCGRHGYGTLLKLGFHLPALVSIRGWISKLDFFPGRCEQIIGLLKDKATRLNDKEKDCILCYDETAVKRSLLYNRFKDCIEGVQKIGSLPIDKFRIANQAMVFMVRGLNTNWKFPVSFHFSASSMTKVNLRAVLNQTLDDLEACGLKVRACISDQGANNVAVQKDLGSTMDKPYVNRGDKKLYFLNDSPHLIKNIRNNLMKYGYQVPYKGERVIITWKLIEDFIDYDMACESRLCPKLTKSHADPSHSEKMKVRLATQLFSRTVAAGIRTRLKTQELQTPLEYEALADFIEKMDTIFDLLNISQEFDHTKPLKSGRDIFSNVDLMTSLREYIGQITKADGNIGNLLCLKGLRMNLLGIRMLVSDLKAEGYGFVLTRRIQTDCVEHLFSLIKLRIGRGNTPTCQQFRYSFRYMLVTYMIQGPVGSNCENHDDDDLQDTLQKIDCLLSPPKEAVANEEEAAETDEFESGSSDSNDEERVSYEINSFFRGFGDLDSTPASKNGAVFLGGRSVKKTIHNTKCVDCRQMLEFISERQIPVIDSVEYFHQFKASTPNVFTKETELGFGHMLKKSSREAFIRISEIFPVTLRDSFNQYGTSIVANILRGLIRDEKVRQWRDSATSDVCKEHRNDVLRRFIRTKIYCLMKQMSDDMSISRR